MEFCDAQNGGVSCCTKCPILVLHKMSDFGVAQNFDFVVALVIAAHEFSLLRNEGLKMCLEIFPNNRFLITPMILFLKRLFNFQKFEDVFFLFNFGTTGSFVLDLSTVGEGGAREQKLGTVKPYVTRLLLKAF